jgi:lipid A disaccharide synthetase
MPRILIITGEASGDLHGANLVKALRQADPSSGVVGIGGVLMKAAGAELVPNTTDSRAVAFALLLHVVNLATYIGAGLVGLWVEDVSLGEVMHAAQRLRARQSAPENAS